MPIPSRISDRSTTLQRTLAIALFLLVCGICKASEASTERYLGIAYDPKGRELYRETHWLTDSAGERELLVLFRCPDGKAFARKHAYENRAPMVPSFALEDGRSGYREGVRASNVVGTREVYVQREHDQLEKRAPVPQAAHLVFDAGFDAYIRANWDALMDGKKRVLDFMIPSRLETIPLSVRQIEDGSLQGQATRRFRLELDTWYAFAIPSMEVSYDRETRAMLEYRGIGNVRTNAGKRLFVRLDFPISARTRDVHADEINRARKEPLQGRCEL